MTDPEPIVADLLLDRHVTPEQEQPLTDALTALGYSPSVRVLPPRRAVEPLTWLILIALPLQAFLTTLGEKAAEDGYGLFQKAIRAIRRPAPALAPTPVPAPEPPPAPVVLQDPATGLRVILEHDLPDEGYRQLLTIDLTQYRLGPLHYDQARGHWRSELDEVQLR
ncbi:MULTISPECIES: hypothetical protein [unclassified Streptomyces]|uniref:hypothetical protein n=1 Tax=unclassified Streptomyces TaxID=2593676 RepID=UPI002E806C44|nr:hypothetical protein [Streptomyces sp. NBC_00589]WTI40366.1 hypothetical protein OIC96_37935 [Streptomyces sp. NBC_00775]WUB25951.1 hypothetical protein OHA51_11795 [Streptomyces sp. NBC_00589]